MSSPAFLPQLTEQEVRALAQLPLEDLTPRAHAVSLEYHGTSVFLRGLIEATNHCAQNCLYCGIRRNNAKVRRYRLSREEILAIVERGFAFGFRTFVIQGGEDPCYTTEFLASLCEEIKNRTAGKAAITLSFGTKSLAAYRSLARAGADRYLMRFETADPVLHEKLRNGNSLASRLKALDCIRESGLQVGSGFMVGLPGETEETLIQNIMLAGKINMDMGGVGPFIPHPDTPLRCAVQKPIELAIRATALLRLMLPHCHIPATTAAGSLDPLGREKMLAAGANVLMPNITTVEHKKDYQLYPGKICIDESGFQCVSCQAMRIASVGLSISWDRGDALRLKEGSHVW